MSKRKIFLLAAIFVLLCTYILQTALSLKSPVQNKTLTDDISKVTIERTDEKIELTKENESWFLGSQKYLAGKSDVDSILASIKNVVILDTVVQSGNENTDLRYEINSDSTIIVTAYNSEKEIRKLYIGKVSATGAQSYIKLDNSKNIYLVKGRLKDIFSKTQDEIRSKVVYSTESVNLTSITQNANGEEIAISKTGEVATWGATNNNIQINAEKAATWATSVASLNAEKWLEDNFTLPEIAQSTTEIKTNDKTITVTIYKEEGDTPKYYGTCSEVPYKFELSQYSAEKYFKKLTELTQTQ